jgi:hypothetical protein
MLQSKNGIEPLGAPEVTSVSGRQVQTQVNPSGPQQVGPILHMVPYVLADGYTINLATIIPIGDPDRQGHFPGTTIVKTANIWDNQTFLLGLNYTSAEGVTGSQIQNPDTEDKELLVLVTATVVDSTGKWVHSDDELPFAQKGFPPQPPPQTIRSEQTGFPIGLEDLLYPDKPRTPGRGIVPQ